MLTKANPVNRIDPSGHYDGLAGQLTTGQILGTLAVISVLSVIAVLNIARGPLTLPDFNDEVDTTTDTVPAPAPNPEPEPEPKPNPQPRPIPLPLPNPNPDDDDDEHYEDFYRAMGEKEYSRVVASGGNLAIRNNRTELFVTRSSNYALRLSITDSRFPVLLAFKRQIGTEAALIAKGATHNSARYYLPHLRLLPRIEDVGENNPNYVQLKYEKGALTFGLRHGTIGIFNGAKSGNPSYWRIN